MRAAPALPVVGPWEDRSHLAGMGPEHLLQAWVGRLYSVQRYAVPSRPGWDHLHVQRHARPHNRRPSWPELQAIKAELLEGGAHRLAFEVYPPEHRRVDLAHAWHLWVVPPATALEFVLDLAHELSDLPDQLGPGPV